MMTVDEIGRQEETSAQFVVSK